jgi:hypothetical protein
MKTRCVGWVILFGLFGLYACGGASRPQPLSYRFDDSSIALVSIAEKSEVFQAQSDYHIAEAMHAKAKAELEQARTDLTLAENEQQQAKLEQKRTTTKKEAADSSHNLTEINGTKREQHAAELSLATAERRVEYLKSYITFLERRQLYAEEYKYSQEARFEEAKARLANGKNIKPDGFEYENFKKQMDERATRTEAARLLTVEEKRKAEEKGKGWMASKEQAEQARGIKPTQTSATGAR